MNTINEQLYVLSPHDLGSPEDDVYRDNVDRIIRTHKCTTDSQEPFALLLSRLLFAMSDIGTYMGSDDIIKGEPCFRHDFRFKGKQFTLFLTDYA